MYIYIHTNGMPHIKPDGVVEMGGGPDVFFDSPFVERWYYINTVSLRTAELLMGMMAW